jgi:hypothetical protein
MVDVDDLIINLLLINIILDFVALVIKYQPIY